MLLCQFLEGRYYGFSHGEETIPHEGPDVKNAALWCIGIDTGPNSGRGVTCRDYGTHMEYMEYKCRPVFFLRVVAYVVRRVVLFLRVVAYFGHRHRMALLHACLVWMLKEEG